MKKHQFSHTVTEYHDDGSSTVHHIHKKHGHVHTVPERDGDVRGAVADHDALMDHMMDHIGMPNQGEDQDENGQQLEVPAKPAVPTLGLKAGK